jgi:5'-AMP-activated protein kinase catalytic alpha subunit
MIILGEYKVGKTIGEGAFSKVKAAVHIPSGVKVAIKIIYKESMNQSKKSIEEEFNDSLSDQPTRKGVYGGDSITNSAKTFLSTMEKEVKLLMRLNHPNIIKTYQFIDGEKESFVVMQLAMGEMADFMITKGKLSDKEGRKYFRQLISGIDYIHKANVVHRDLKLENLLLDENHNLLISDFGLGRVISRDSNQLLDTFCGTPNYAAAELISAIPYLGTKSDIWYRTINFQGYGCYSILFYGGNYPLQREGSSQSVRKYQSCKL